MGIYEKILEKGKRLLNTYFKNNYLKQLEIYSQENEANDRLRLMKEMLKRGFNSSYDLGLFSDGQLYWILEGLKAGVDVSVYAKPCNIYMKDAFKTLVLEKSYEKKVLEVFKKHDYSWSQKLEIIRGFEVFGMGGVKIYADPKLDWQQMKKIRLDLTEIYNKMPIPRDFDNFDDNWGLDLNSYIKPEYLEEEIKKHIRHERQCEKKAEKLLSKHNFRWFQKVEILEGIDNNIDVFVYAKPAFDCHQMQEIRLGLKKGLDVSVYADPSFSCLQMETIRKGLEKELDVSIYTDSKIDYYKMEIMRICLEKGLDISTYANPKFNNDQLREIMWGLQKEVAVSIYADPKLNWDQMSKIRNRLQNSRDKESVELIGDNQIEKENGKIKNKISEIEDEEELEL